MLETMSQPYYDSDLNDEEWQQIEPLLPPEKPVGKLREINMREVLNAIFYRADNGIKWRNLPCDFPAWQTVYGYNRLWVRLGIWEQINSALVQQVRVKEGREAQPSLAIIDSQSVKLGQKGVAGAWRLPPGTSHPTGEEHGVDGNKRIKGRKRHIVKVYLWMNYSPAKNRVDVLGLVLGCYVTAANSTDVKAAPAVLMWVLDMDERIAKVLADKGYQGALATLIGQAFDGRKVEVEISQRPEEATGFQVERKRWIVERTWTWLENARILARDYERLPENHAGMIYVVMIRLMLRRLAKNCRIWKSKYYLTIVYKHFLSREAM